MRIACVLNWTERPELRAYAFSCLEPECIVTWGDRATLSMKGLVMNPELGGVKFKVRFSSELGAAG